MNKYKNKFFEDTRKLYFMKVFKLWYMKINIINAGRRYEMGF
jgi:hypothetical protein